MLAARFVSAVHSDIDDDILVEETRIFALAETPFHVANSGCLDDELHLRRMLHIVRAGALPMGRLVCRKIFRQEIQ